MRLPFVAGGFDLSKYEAAGKPRKRFAQEPSEHTSRVVFGMNPKLGCCIDIRIGAILFRLFFKILSARSRRVTV
jgi:hypothetical protein